MTDDEKNKVQAIFSIPTAVIEIDKKKINTEDNKFITKINKGMNKELTFRSLICTEPPNRKH